MQSIIFPLTGHPSVQIINLLEQGQVIMCQLFYLPYSTNCPGETEREKKTQLVQCVY